MAESFPYGQDWAQRDRWLGSWTAKSRRWSVSYEGNFSIVCGYHSFIFLGLDSLSIGVVSLTGCGPSIGVPVGKLLGRLNPRDAQRIEQTWERSEQLRGVDGHFDLQDVQAGYDSGLALYAKMQEAIPQRMVAREPFSLSDLNGKAGAVAGAEVEVVGSASVYFIEATHGFLGEYLFGPQIVSNSGGGLISASAGGLTGAWSVDQCYNIYTELSRRTLDDDGIGQIGECIRQNTWPAYDQPYRAIHGAHPAIQELPPYGCSSDLPPDLFDPTAIIERFR